MTTVTITSKPTRIEIRSKGVQGAPGDITPEALAARDAAQEARDEAQAARDTATGAASAAALSADAAEDAAQIATQAAETEAAVIAARIENDLAPVVAGVGYAPPVPFASGLVVDSSRITVEHSGQVYAPLPSELPFTTTGTFNPAQWRLVQGVVGADLSADSGSEMVGFRQSGAEAELRTLQDKIRETVSVLDYATPAERSSVALRSGAFDATALVQRAVNAAVGKRLHFPAGLYRINTEPNTMPFPWYGGVVVPSNSWLVFDSTATVEAIPNAESKSMILSLYNSENVVIEGGKFIGDRANHTYLNMFDTLADLNSGNYRTKGNYDPDPAVWPEGTVAYVYQDGANNGTYQRVGGAWSRTATTVPNYSTHEFCHGINVFNSRNVWIRGVTITDCAGDGIFIGQSPRGEDADAWTRGVSVTDCVIEDCRRQGVSVVVGDNITISGCVIRNIGKRKNLQDGVNPRSGIDVESGTGNKSNNVIISNNIIEGCAGASVINYDGSSVVISQNTVDSPISYGWGFNTTISGNVLNGAGITGSDDRATIAFTYTADGDVVTLTTAAPHLIRTDGAKQYFEFLDANGFVEYAGLFAATILSPTSLSLSVPGFAGSTANGRMRSPNKSCKISGNVITGGTIYLQGSGHVVHGNMIYNSVEAGIFVHGTVRKATIAGNTIQGTQILAIFCVAGSEDVTIQGNLITGVRGSSGAGIKTSATRALVTGNHITNAPAGIRVEAGSAVVSQNYVDLRSYPLVRWNGEIYAAGSTTYAEIIGNTVVGSSGSAIRSRSLSLIRDNNVKGFTGTTGITLDAAAAAGSVVMGNRVTSNLAATGNSTAIHAASGANNCRFIGNVVSSENAPLSRALNTNSVTGSRITNNVYEGTIFSAAGDTLAGNVAY